LLRAELGAAALDRGSGGAERVASWKGAGLFATSGLTLGAVVVLWLVFRAPPVARDHGAVPSPKAPAVASVAGAESALAPSTPEPSAAPVAPLVTSAAERPDKSGGLAEEVAILARATADLNAGRSADALRELELHRRRFPNGQLTEERRAARARALCALGRKEEAEVELARLAQKSAHSPNLLRARQVCGLDPKP
jgi:hypothetical protein